MSRGLGKVERLVLAWVIVRDDPDFKYGGCGLRELAQVVAGDREDREEYRVPEPSPATYGSTARAVASLERKGIVRSKMHSDLCETTHYKIIRLSVDSLANLPAIQRLTASRLSLDAWPR